MEKYLGVVNNEQRLTPLITGIVLTYIFACGFVCGMRVMWIIRGDFMNAMCLKDESGVIHVVNGKWSNKSYYGLFCNLNIVKPTKLQVKIIHVSTSVRRKWCQQCLNKMQKWKAGT